jgi:hypothetical protein
LQKCIANRMAKRVVHYLEAVEIHAKHREAFATPGKRERFLQPQVEKHTVRHAGQCIMVRYVRDACLIAATLSYVLNREQPASVRQSPRRDCNHTVTTLLLENHMFPVHRFKASAIGIDLIDSPSWKVASQGSNSEDLAVGHTYMQAAGRHAG